MLENSTGSLRKTRLILCQFIRGTDLSKADTAGDIWKDSTDLDPTNVLLPNGLLIAIIAFISVLAAYHWRKRLIAK